MISVEISWVIFFLAKKPTFDQCTGKYSVGTHKQNQNKDDRLC